MAVTTRSKSTPTTQPAAPPPSRNQRRRRRQRQPNSLLTHATPSSSSLPLPPRPTTHPVSDTHYGLIQETLAPDTYQLVVQAMLWNQTSGISARPVLSALLTRYPTPEALAAAATSSLATLLRPIGLQNVRANRLLQMAKAWVERPPCRERRYAKKGYTGEWEIAHLPGVGPYALDSFRIFARDGLRGVEHGEEWKRVWPLDRELRAYLVWRWRREGWVWDPLTGRKRRVGDDDGGGEG